MKPKAMKAKYILAIFCGMLFCEAFLSAQTEEFRFKLYLESLSSGKKDTLELGVGPNGYAVHDCRYDSNLCPVYTSPFFDTAEHIGAFVVPAVKKPYSGEKFRVECPIYGKKRIGLLKSDLVVIFPAKEQPVKVSWDMRLLQDPIIKTPIMTNIDEGGRFDCHWRLPILLFMSEEDTCLIDYSIGEEWFDSVSLYTYITDSAGREHPYIHFYVLPGWDRKLSDLGDDWGLALENSNQQFSVSVSPNPIHNRFKINSDVALKEWRIHSVSGKLILSGKGNDTEIDCQGWASGIYVFRWESKNHETGVGKLIKK